MVRDLSHAAGQLTALGFNLTARSYHTVPNPDGSLRPAGTANHCAMLQRGYLEVIAVTDPSAESFSRNEIGGFAARFEGLHLLAIGTASAGEVEARLNMWAEPFVAARSLHRKVDTPDGPRDASFRLIIVPQLSGSDITFFFIEHQTAELLWTPESMVHPNGATGLLELIVVDNNLETTGLLYEKAFGIGPTEGDGILSFALDRSRFLVLTEMAALRHFGAPVPTHDLPHCAGQAVEVADLSMTAALLTSKAVPFTRAGGRLTIAPEFAGGAFLQFAEAEI